MTIVSERVAAVRAQFRAYGGTDEDADNAIAGLRAKCLAYAIAGNAQETPEAIVSKASYLLIALLDDLAVAPKETGKALSNALFTQFVSGESVEQSLHRARVFADYSTSLP